MDSPRTTERSASRGRGFESSGRGGAGNIGRLQSPDARPVDGPDDFSVTRGREPIPANAAAVGRAVSAGRGGAGNIRAPSNSRESGEYEAERIRAIDEANETGIRTTGRGGAGNLFRSPSRSQERSRSRGPGVHSVGRGGVGNIKVGEPTEVTILEVEDQERLASAHHESGFHSTGRGGIANIRHHDDSAPEREVVVGHPHEHHTHEFQTTGRGGAGNIHSRSRSASREPQRGRVAAFFNHLKGKDGEHTSAQAVPEETK